MSVVTVDALFTGLCDDAAIFPPGNLPLADAVPAHRAHRQSEHRDLVGPFVVAATHLRDLGRLLTDDPPGSFDLAVTVPSPGDVAVALHTARQVPAARVRALEVVVPAGFPADAVVPSLDAALATDPEVEAYVELPRDDRRRDVVAALAGTRHHAKLRTGGVRHDLYPDERELADAVVALAAADVAFKATAGLHHAVRNTDPVTGFEQHGFLNLLVAVDAAQSGASNREVAALLAERDTTAVGTRVRRLVPEARRVRGAFHSFGTCSIDDPRTELAGLGLLDTTPGGAPTW